MDSASLLDFDVALEVAAKSLNTAEKEVIPGYVRQELRTYLRDLIEWDTSRTAHPTLSMESLDALKAIISHNTLVRISR